MLEFVNPWLLWGALLGIVPVVIHFLQRRSWNEVDWGAMMFLQRAVKRRQRQSRVESLLLLSVRCLIPILAAVALSQPIVSGLEQSGSGETRRHWIFVVDRSASMQTIVEGRTHFDAAREAILRTLDRAQPGDMFSLIGISSASDAKIVDQPTRDRDEFARVVRRLEPTTESSRLDEVLIDLPERVRRNSQGVQTQVVVLSDFAAVDWERSTLDATRIRERLASLAELAEVNLIDVSSRGVTNVGITDVRVTGGARRSTDLEAPDDESATATDASDVVVLLSDEGSVVSSEPTPPAILSVNQPATISIVLEHHGASTDDGLASDGGPTTTREVQVAVEGREIHGSSVSVPVGKRIELRVPWTPTRPGQHRVSVSLSSDALTVDDVRYCVVDVEDRIDVLIIDGAPHARASRFVELALNPWQEASGAATAMGPLLDVTTAGIERLLQGDFARFDVVILCDVPVLSEPDVARLTRFVESGGGLIVGLGPDSDLEAYSRWVFASSGLCELSIGELVGDPETLEEPFRLVMDQPQHPVMLRFARHPRAGLQTSRLNQYIAVRIPDSSPAESIFSAGNGDPLLIEHSLGEGRCLIVTTALDDRWGSWVLWPSFVPLVHEMVTFVAAGKLDHQALVVGDFYRLWLPEDAPQSRIIVEGPDLQSVSMRTTFSSRGMQAETAPLLLPGIYELERVGGTVPSTEFLAVNVDAHEGDLDPADLEALNHASERIRVESVNSWQSTTRMSDESADLASLLARRLLTVVLCLLVIEPILARNFRIGLILLLTMSTAIVLQFLVTLLR